MRVETERSGEVTIIQLFGRLDTSTAPDAQESLHTAIDSGARKIILDLAELEYISSAGLRVLLSAAKKLKGAGGGLRFCNLNDTVEEVFEISGFDSIFDLYPTRSDAVSGF